MLCKSAVSGAVKGSVVACTITLLSGCVAEQRLTWSPDGKKLALVGSDGVRVSTDGGLHLGEPVEEDAQLVSWFPDSKRVVVVSKSGCESWADLENQVDKAEVDGIKASADQFLKQLESCNGDFAVCRDALLKEGFNANYLAQALYYLRATAPDKMSKLVGREWAAMKLNDSMIPISSIKVFDVEAKGSLHARHTVARSTDDFESAKVSPSNEFVCLVDNDGNLQLASTDSHEKGFREIASGFAKLPDWDVDTDVIYGLHTITKKIKASELKLQELVSIDARKPKSMKHLADVSSGHEKVRATVAGNLLFVSDATIRSKNGKTRNVETLNLFALSSGKARRIYLSAKGDRLENFEVSPDGKNVSVPNATGAVKVIALRDGKARLIASGNSKNEGDVFTPVWKNNEEICFEKVMAPDGHGQVALFSLHSGTTKNISSDWPINAVSGVLTGGADKPLTFEKMIDQLKERKKRLH